MRSNPIRGAGRCAVQVATVRGCQPCLSSAVLMAERSPPGDVRLEDWKAGKQGQVGHGKPGRLAEPARTGSSR